MKLHNLKIKSEYAIPKLFGLKMFEVRFNDRHYNVGDTVKYTCVDNHDVDSVISHNLYMISFITDYAQKDGYIVFGEVLVPNEIHS